MTRTRSAGTSQRPRRRLALAVAALTATTGCSAGSGTGASPDAPPAAAPRVVMRLDQPAKLFGSWQESRSRILHGHAQQSMAHFKTMLAGDPGSAVGVSYTSEDERYTALVSGVSGTVTDPTAALDAVFDGLTRLTEVAPTPAGPLGGEARCGTGRTSGVRIEVCAWADEHTIGAVTLIGYPDAHQPAPQFLLVRSQLEHPAP